MSILKRARTKHTVAVCLAGLAVVFSVAAANNSWINPSSGKWETSTNWSIGAPGPDQSVFITNSGTKAVTVDSVTGSLAPSTMTIGNLNLSAPNGSTNTLRVLAPGFFAPFTVTNALNVASGGSLFVSNANWGSQKSLTVSNGTAVVIGDLLVPFYQNIQFTVTGPSATSSNSGNLFFYGGSSNQMLVANGARVDTGDIYLGYGGIAENFDTVTVTGTNSRLNVGFWNIGQSGSSNLVYISSGGTVRTTGIITLSSDPASQGNSITLLPGGKLVVGDQVYVAYTNGAQATFRVSGGSSVLPSNLVAGSFSNSTATVSVTDGGLLAASNSVIALGNGGTPSSGSGSGNLTVSNGTLIAAGVILGSTAGGSGSLVVQTNSTVTVSSNITVVSGSLFVTNSITLNGGALMASNGVTQVGPNGNGLLTINGGSHTFRQLKLGATNGIGSGGLHFTGGHLRILGTGTGRGQGLVSNWILWEGGDLDGSGSSLTIAQNSDSTVTIPFAPGAAPVSGQLNSMYVGDGSGWTGTYTQSGLQCQITISGQMILGDCNSGAVGNVTLNSGTLYVMNASHTAVLDVRNGTFIVNAGAILVADNLTITTACGHLICNPGGQVILFHPPVLAPGMDADGDGQSNGAELAAGTDPLGFNTPFKVTAVTANITHDVRLDWTVVAGHSYVVQSSAVLSGSGFTDLSPIITVPVGAPDSTTSWVHVGGASGSKQFYRIRLSQQPPN